MSNSPVIGEELLHLADNVTLHDGLKRWANFLKQNIRELIHHWPLFNIYAVFLGLGPEGLSSFEYEQLTIKNTALKKRIAEALVYIEALPDVTGPQIKDILSRFIDTDQLGTDADDVSDDIILKIFYMNIILSKPVDDYETSISACRSYKVGGTPMPQFTLNYHHHYTIEGEVSLAPKSGLANVQSYSAPPEFNQMLKPHIPGQIIYDKLFEELSQSISASTGSCGYRVFSENLFIGPIWNKICTNARLYFNEELRLLFTHYTVSCFHGAVSDNRFAEAGVIDNVSDLATSITGISTADPISEIETSFSGSTWDPSSGILGDHFQTAMFDDDCNRLALRLSHLHIPIHGSKQEIKYSRRLRESTLSNIFELNVLKPAIDIINIMLSNWCESSGNQHDTEDTVRITYSMESDAQDEARQFSGDREEFNLIEPDYLVSLNETVPLFPIEMKRRLDEDFLNSTSHEIRFQRTSGSSTRNATTDPAKPPVDENFEMNTATFNLPKNMSENTRKVIMEIIGYMMLSNCIFGMGNDLFNGYIISLKDKDEFVGSGKSVADFIQNKSGVTYKSLPAISSEQILSIVVLDVIPINSTGTNPCTSDNYTDKSTQTGSGITLKLAIMCLIIKTLKSVLGEDIFEKGGKELKKEAKRVCQLKFDKSGSFVPFQMNLQDNSTMRSREIKSIEMWHNELKVGMEEQLLMCEKLYLNLYNQLDSSYADLRLCEISGSQSSLKEIRSNDDYHDSEFYHQNSTYHPRTFELSLQEFMLVFDGILDDEFEIDRLNEILARTHITTDDSTGLDQLVKNHEPMMVRLEIYDILTHYERCTHSITSSLNEEEKSSLDPDLNRLLINGSMPNVQYYKEELEFGIRKFKERYLNHKKVLNVCESFNAADHEQLKYEKPVYQGRIVLFDKDSGIVKASGMAIATFKEPQLIIPSILNSASSTSTMSSMLGEKFDEDLTSKLETQFKNLEKAGLSISTHDLSSRDMVKLRVPLELNISDLDDKGIENMSHDDFSAMEEVIIMRSEPYFNNIDRLMVNINNSTPREGGTDISDEVKLAKGRLLSTSYSDSMLYKLRG